MGADSLDFTDCIWKMDVTTVTFKALVRVTCNRCILVSEASQTSLDSNVMSYVVRLEEIREEVFCEESLTD